MKPNRIIVMFWYWAFYSGFSVGLMMISIDMMNTTFIGLLSVCIGWGILKSYHYGNNLKIMLGDET